MSFASAIGETIRRGSCVLLGNLASRVEVLRYVVEPTGLPTPATPAEMLYALNCGLPRPPQPTVPIPFNGGQCAGTQYRINHSVTFERNGQADITFNGLIDVWGPVSAGVLFNTASQAGVKFTGATSGTNATRREYIGVSSSVAAGFPKAKSYTVTSIIPLNGGADNCGNLPNGRPYQPGDNTVTDSVTYVNNNNTTVTIPVDITFGYAFEAPDLSLNFPVSLTFSANPELNVNGTFNFSTGEFTAPASGTPASPSGCVPGKDAYKPGPGLPPVPPSVPGSPEPPPSTNPEAEKQKVIKAAMVTTSVLDGNETVIFQSDNPDIYAPAVGYVQFLIQVGNSIAWTNDIPVKSLRAFIPCPWEAGAISVKGTPRYGNEFRVDPVYVSETINPTYPA